MSSTPDTPQGGFRLSLLLNDTRYRSYPLQLIALVAILAAMAFHGGNLEGKLDAAGLQSYYDE